VLASGLDTLGSVRVSRGDVYAVSGNSILEVLYANRAVTTVVESQYPIMGLAVDATGVYLATMDQTVEVVRSPGAKPQVLASTASYSAGVDPVLALDDVYVYWLGDELGVIKSKLVAAAKDGGGSHTVSQLDTLSAAPLLVRSPSSFVFVDGWDVATLAIGDSSPDVLTANRAVIVTALAADEANVYFATIEASGFCFLSTSCSASPPSIPSKYGLYAVPRAGGSVLDLIVGPFVTSLVDGGDSLYLVRDFTSLVRFDKTTREVTLLAGGKGSPSIGGVAVDGGYVYWTPGGRVLRMPRQLDAAVSSR
jgi:hypothetical protein